MFHSRHLFYFILLHFIVATPQINLHYTSLLSESDDDNTLQHDCLRTIAKPEQANVNRQIISYCMSELPSKFGVEQNDVFPNFTFAKLSKENITSQQLYLWSAPIDVIERYQLYLNQLSTSNQPPSSTEIFYNCTMPRFGPMCQYEFVYHRPSHSSLYEIIRDFYYRPFDIQYNFTCYTHLKCNRGPSPSCLDWSEICDGKVDCLDGEFDEEHCWQLEINECEDNQFRCTNGQCIPQSFLLDDFNVPDCLDGSDEARPNYNLSWLYTRTEPSFGSEDVTCTTYFLTSSCVLLRQELLNKAIFSAKDKSIPDDCYTAFICMIDQTILSWATCHDVCEPNMCVTIVNRTCPNMLYLPAVPVLFGHVYFAYEKNDAQILKNEHQRYPYVCYNNSRYDSYFVNASKVLFNNTTCYRHNDIVSNRPRVHNWVKQYLIPIYRDLRDYNQISMYNQTFNHISTICNRSKMYQCANSLKCILLHRLMNFEEDCPHGDDENITDIMKKRLAEELIGMNSWYNDQLQQITRYARKKILFQTICDGFTELLPITIEGQNKTDETDCEQWQCNNTYTRCDGLWNCLNGADEVDCDLLPPFNCPLDHHICVSPHTNQFICLPVTKANDGNVDCLGASDEPKLCRKEYQLSEQRLFYCINDRSRKCVAFYLLCNGGPTCDHGDDEQFCEKNRTYNNIHSSGICVPFDSPFASNIEKFLCNYATPKQKQLIIYFALDGMNTSLEVPAENVKNPLISSPSVQQMLREHQYRCYHGLPLRVWVNDEKNFPTSACLCPPSFYGDMCQYQSQRISLAIQFRAFSDSWQTPFAIVISLIDDSTERIVHSYEQFTYLSVRDCKIKFNVYLLYLTGRKNATKDYAIHVDIYEKVSLTYRGSLLFPVIFPFLPVQRLAFIVNIPRSNDNVKSCSNDQCNHGKCIRYSNNPQNITSFCQCDERWSGRYCNIQHTSMCLSGSICIGVSAHNRSICVCPINKFGPQCLLVNTACQTNGNSTCRNDGQCIPTDEYMVSDQTFVCICSKGFTGDRCDIADNKLILSFSKDIVPSQSIFIHFIEIINNDVPVRATTLRTISVIPDSFTIYWSRPFHLVFIELFNAAYYLTVVQKTYNRSSTIIKTINPSHHCPYIGELFNETFAQWHLLRRIKYYHLPCEKYFPDLSCFYDDIHLCLCYDYGQKRLANCFSFEHNMTNDCLGQSVCENGAKCFQDNPNCPKSSMCVCPPCFYGTRCQFSTSGFGLSLDAILGYHILPNANINHQPFIVQFSLALTIIFIVAGLINGVLSMITFKNKTVREVGCGLYLLGSSITTLLTTLMFGLKFSILILAQMTPISNRSFLQVQCISIDFLLRICLNIDQWLNACVAMERAYTVMKNTQFDKKKTKQTAKFVIVILVVMIIGTSIHDPIYRRLIDEQNDDTDEKRIWCIVTYPYSLQIFNSIVHIIHFFGPFIINLISAVILITKKSDHEATVHTDRTYKELLREQCRQHKNLFTAPVLLVILAVPRIIITFVSKCMKSAGDSWLYLTGYFISFIPPMLTFVVFILPSKFYRKEFHKSLAYYRTNIQKRLHLIP